MTSGRCGGPGTQLRAIIPKHLGRKACHCEDVAAYMDRIGPAGCRRNWEKLVKHLVYESAKNPIGSIAPEKLRKTMAERWLRKAIELAEAGEESC